MIFRRGVMRVPRLSELIAPGFYGLHGDIKRGRYTHYWLKGGRGSTKSSFVSLEIVLGMMLDRAANAVVLRKVGQTLRESVFEQLLWAIRMLDVERYWVSKVSPLELVYEPTGQRIVFRGADSPRKLKSIKFREGYCKFVWYEEADEFGGMEELRSINQSLLRGGERFGVFYTYNPPRSVKSWVNLEAALPYPDRVVHESSYLSVPAAWLGERFLLEAAHLKAVQPELYRHEYLGEVTGTGGEVFRNVTVRRITEEEVRGFDHVSRGIDWGYAADPFHYTVNHFDRARRRLFIFYELHRVGLGNRQAVALVKAENRLNGEIVCDSAEPKSIAEFSGYGLRVRGARKGPDSVGYGIRWLQELEEIVIDPVRCPHTAREFTGYELLRDENGEFRAGFPDRENHSIDAVRYSREDDMRLVRVR